MAEFASKGVAGSGLGLGIAGTALGVLSSGGWLANLTGRNGYATCSENMPVTRYEQELTQKLAEKDSQISLRDANTYNDQKMLELYKFFDGELKEMRATQNAKWTEQAVINCQNSSGLKVLSSQVADITATVNSITKTAVPTSAICNFGCGCGCGTDLV